MSLDITSESYVCYVHCNFCTTILALPSIHTKPSKITVFSKNLENYKQDFGPISLSITSPDLVSVPCTSIYTIVTVRCGHCANLLSVNMGSLVHSLPIQEAQKQQTSSESTGKDNGSSSKWYNFDAFKPTDPSPMTPPIRPPEKRQRVPSAYNRFIKEEIQRIKTTSPEISHREAFSTAAKNWAHLPQTHFGLKLDGNKEAKLDMPFGG